MKATRQTLDNEYGVSAASAEDAEAVRLIASAIGKRAARLSAVAIAAVILSTGALNAPPTDIATVGSRNPTSSADEEEIDIGVDGSLVEFYPMFEEYIREALRGVKGIGAAGEKRVRIGIAKDGSGVGAALIALVADRAGKGLFSLQDPLVCLDRVLMLSIGVSSPGSTPVTASSGGFFERIMASVNRSLRMRV